MAPSRTQLLGVAGGAACLALLLVVVTPNANPSELFEVMEIPAGAEIVNIPRSALHRQRSVRSSALSGGIQA